MRQTYTLLIFVFLAMVSTDSMAQEGINKIKKLDNGSILIANFERYQEGTLPDDWYNRDGDRRPATYSEEGKQEYQYEVTSENGNKFLRYHGQQGKHLNFPLVGKEIDIHETPILSFKLRVHKVPEGGNEDRDGHNDSAAGVYMVFDMGRVLLKRVPKSIKYAWSSELPEGTELSKFFGNQKIVIIESGTTELGKWITFKRNIVEDYKRLFGDSPPATPIALLILSDGDSTNSEVMADYDDIKLMPKK